ncbi:MAG: bacterioferritin [Betaproteobacteria bacterium HGW-Betaproteobacteria-13]|uniref:Bacterioferritin-associated ferredoxin n=1 Tax=Parazoarcus communis TaxID=41977 RepID=A0A2U8H212_9RHOO|nr:(2Fe-2S)-binding protein [Parazoarcus communis]AWI79660.1 bacterioferritin [Parazoarcus communis]PKO80276.1 MAG: bacterioferritin [Betaproteobacteria bacterium HGW-Betaproteobacteria-13]
MYVCVCNAVTESHIEEAVRKGATTLRHLRLELGVSAECGRCATCARDCLRTALDETTAQRAAQGTLLQRSIFPSALEAV